MMEQATNQIKNQELREVIKKSALVAEGKYDISKLCYQKNGLLNCNIEEEKEELNFVFDIKGKKQIIELRKETKQNKLSALIDATHLIEIYHEYYFELSEDNLFYDRNYRVYIKNRDVYERGIKSDSNQFLESFKALVGCIMQKKYTFNDYYNGGMELFHKNKFLKPILSLESIEEIKAYLEKTYYETVELTQEKRIEVDKTWYKTGKWGLIIFLLFTIVTSVYISYFTFILDPRDQAIIKANNAYLDSNYIQVIDEMKKVDLKYLDKYQKYLLAVSYVKCENLAPEQKENVLETLSIDGEEKLKEYWIYLGRLETEESINIALQRSDDELLLYSYLTQKAFLEKNTELSGEEKTAKLNELTGKIEGLAKKYETK